MKKPFNNRITNILLGLTLCFGSILVAQQAKRTESKKARQDKANGEITVVIHGNEFPGHTRILGYCADKKLSFSYGPAISESRTVKGMLEVVTGTPSTTGYESKSPVVKSRTFVVTAEQCKNIFGGLADTNGTYTLLLNNCTTTVLNALKAGGITIPDKKEWTTNSMISIQRSPISPRGLGALLDEMESEASKSEKSSSKQTKRPKQSSPPKRNGTREGSELRDSIRERTIERRTPEKKTPEKKTPEKKTPEKKTPEKKTPEKKTPEKKTPEIESRPIEIPRPA